MFAASVFTTATSSAPPEWLGALVDWLIRKRRVDNGLTRYSVTASTPECWDGWCHGQAGHINALLSVYRVTRTDETLRLACDLGRSLGRRPPSSTAHLCCGSSGIGYAFLGLFAATGEPAWLRLARRSCTHALKTCHDPEKTIDTSLWKGPWGVACLEADLISQRFSSPPAFGWDDVV
jgi:Lanthionine synthetase C-like protein